MCDSDDKDFSIVHDDDFLTDFNDVSDAFDLERILDADESISMNYDSQMRNC